MPTFEHGKLTGVAFDEYDLTSFLNEMTSTVEVETGDTTTFDKTARTYILGMENSTYSLSGLWANDDTNSTPEIDEILDGAIGVQDSAHLLLQQGYETTDSPGVRCYFGRGDLSSYEISNPVGDIVSVSAEVQGDRGLFHGVILHDPNSGGGDGNQQVASATTTDNASVDNTASTSDGFTAQLHVVDANDLDGDLIVTVEHSTDDSTWSTLGTFATVAGGNTAIEQITGTGTVDQYVRISIDTTAATTGNAQIFVGFSRVNKTRA